MYLRSIIVFLFLIACQPIAPVGDKSNILYSTGDVMASTVYSFKTFENEDKTYGYAIYTEQRMIIKQSFIPVINGIHGFKTNEDAEAIASLMIKKLTTGDMPPSITLEEIEKLNITL